MPGESNVANAGVTVFSESCDQYVEQYRAGEVTFSAAIGGIAKMLVSGGADRAKLETGISSYVGSLQEVNRDWGEASARGRENPSAGRTMGDKAVQESIRGSPGPDLQ
jgi:hypothetical protein